MGNIHSGMTPLFTVIIPVKNRGNYIEHTLRTCVNSDYENLEIIVSDDNSSDDTGEIVRQMASMDKRIKYYSHVPGLGMRDNFEFALSRVRPGFVIALGGDDGIMPNGILGMLETLRETKKEILSWPAALYSFPNVYGPNGQLVINHRKGVRIIKSQDYINRQIRSLYYLTDVESPMFYVKGVVSTRLIDQIKNVSCGGRFYSCSTPDGYSGIALSGVVDEYAFTGEPYSIYGMSSSSQGLAYLSDDEQAILDSEAFFRDSELRPMHSRLGGVPYSPLITLMTLDFLFTANDIPGWRRSIDAINYKNVIDCALRELSLGVYGKKRICRELSILHEVARVNNVEGYFLDSVSKIVKKQNIKLFDGNGVSPNVFYIDAKPFDVRNIFDASYVAQGLYRMYKEMSFKSIGSAMVRSVLYRIKRNCNGERFPDQSAWEKIDFKTASRNGYGD